MSDHERATAVELARAALPEYGLPADTPLTLLKQRENVVFALTARGTDYVLRVHRRGYHSDAELACELDFVRALASEGVAVPHFVPARDGRGFCVVGADHPAGPHQVDLQHRIENSGNFGDERTAVAGTAELAPSDFRELGRLAAEVHAASVNSGYTMAVPRDDWDLDGLVGDAPAWGDPLRLAELADDDRDTVARAIARIREVLAAYGAPAHRFGPIHADLTPENVLRTPAGLVLIDFDDFAAGWHLFDLATAIYFFTPHPRASEYRAELFAGYESVRPLDPADHAAFPAMLLARGLTYLGWAADRRGEPTAEWHAAEVLPHVVRLARELLAADAAPGHVAPAPASPTTSTRHTPPTELS
ncbi:phosphotransferase enzyme family protein [Leucobacter chromiireducens]|uniref:phosphotransferase enzyme family protein n=1 Tax=Leucobacter chromiireducens TaxID=283877 RepID=UPI000F64393A|nr:phosphotransferase [Leucobacter chromiireducens]